MFKLTKEIPYYYHKGYLRLKNCCSHVNNPDV